MIAACPKCSARYRIERERLEPAGARLRCARCQAVFRVRPPRSEGEESAPVAAAPPAPEAPRPRGPKVLIATPNLDAGKETVGALQRWGFQTALVHDGVEAMLEIQRQLPQVAVVCATLPRMFGFQICEIVKRNESLRSIKVVLIGAINNQERYRRAPGDLQGADAYVEEPDLPEALAEILEGFGFSLYQPPRTLPRGAPAAPPPPASSPQAPPAAPVAPEASGPAPSEAPVESSRPPPAPPAAAAEAGGDDELTKARSEAERLARIVVSDIVLYNEQKFASAIQTGDVVAIMQPELEEGRTLFRARVDERVRGEKDFLAEELLRVARARQAG